MYAKEMQEIYNGNSAPIIALFDRLSVAELNAIAKQENPYAGDRILHAAVRMGDIKLLNKCVLAGLDLNAHKSAQVDGALFHDGRTLIDASPLFLAAQQFQVACLQILLRHLSEEQIHGEFNAEVLGQVIMMYARDKTAREKAMICINELLAYGFDVNKRIQNIPPLFLAIESGDVELVKILLGHEADPMVLCEREQNLTAIAFAIGKNRVLIVKEMLKTGRVDINKPLIFDGNEYPLAFFTALTGSNTLFTLLREAGANLQQNVKLRNGPSAPILTILALILDEEELTQIHFPHGVAPLLPILQQFIQAGFDSHQLMAKVSDKAASEDNAEMDIDSSENSDEDNQDDDNPSSFKFQ